MGKIVRMYNKGDNKVELTLEMTQNEVEFLSGNLDKMYLFSENSLESKTRFVHRGKRESTKYFLLPKDHRKGILLSNEVPCTRIDTKTKCFFIFAVNKF